MAITPHRSEHAGCFGVTILVSSGFESIKDASCSFTHLLALLSGFNNGGKAALHLGRGHCNRIFWTWMAILDEALFRAVE